MTRPVHEKYVRGYWLTALASATLAQVTIAEIAAGTLLPGLVADGLNIAPTDNRASTDMLDSDKVPQSPGTRSMELTMKFIRETVAAEDVGWELFEHNLQGFLVVCRLRFDAAPLAADRVEIYKGASFAPRSLSTAPNAHQQYEVPFACEDWEEKAVVAA